MDESGRVENIAVPIADTTAVKRLKKIGPANRLRLAHFFPLGNARRDHEVLGKNLPAPRPIKLKLRAQCPLYSPKRTNSRHLGNVRLLAFGRRFLETCNYPSN